MRKNKLLLAIVGLLLGLATPGWAQTWSTVGAGDFYLYNEGTGTYLTGSNDWGTKASVQEDGILFTLATLSDGGYSIYAAEISANNKYLGLSGSSPFVDQSSTAWVFTLADESTNAYTIKNDSYGYLAAQSGSTACVAGTGNDAYSYWHLITADNLKAWAEEKGSESNPINLTPLIVNSNFGRNYATSAWSSVGKIDGNNTNLNHEKWHATFETYQTLSDMPTGKYMLKVQGYTRDNDDEYAQFYINDNETNLKQIQDDGLSEDTYGTEKQYDGVYVPNTQTHASAYFSAGLYDNEMTAKVTNSTVKVGVKDTYSDLWFVFDNFRLYYIGALSEEEIMAIEYENAVTAANAVDQTADMSSADLTALQEAIKTYGSLETESATTAELQTATDALKAATEAATASITAYKNAENVLPYMKKLTEETNFYTSDAKNTYYDQWQAKYDEKTLTTAEANALANPYTVTGWRASTGAVDAFLLDVWDDGGTYTLDEATNTYTKTYGKYYINTWSVEGQTTGNMEVPFFEYYVKDDAKLSSKTMTGTITGLEAGTYKVSLQARVRLTNNSQASDSQEAETPTGITANVNGGTTVDLCAGTAETGDHPELYFGEFEVEGTVGEDGTLKLNIVVDGESTNVSWLSFKNLVYAETTNDYTALNEAIKAAVEKTLGFEEGEYAPYNNVKALEALAKAKEIDQTINSSKSLVDELTETLNNAWTANIEEVNAIYDGTFALAEANGAPAGWTMSNNTLGGGTHSRVLNDTRLSGFNNANRAFFIRFDGYNSNRGSMYYYGNTTGYTMPLKGNTYYYLTADFAGWGSTGKPLRLNVSGPDDFTATYKEATTSVNAASTDNTSDPQQYIILFKTGESDGDYTISFQTPGAETNTHNVVVSNLELYKAGIIERSYGYKNGTICYPYTLTPAEGTNIYEIAGRSSDSKTIYFSDAITETTAGKPYIYEVNEATDGNYTATFYYNKREDKSELVDGENGLYGTFDGGTVFSGLTTKCYIVQKGKWVLVPEKYRADYSINPNIAYIKDMESIEEYTESETSSAKGMSIVLDDTTTGISEATLNGEDGDIYNLRGQKVNKTFKGIYIQNGQKKVIR